MYVCVFIYTYNIYRTVSIRHVRKVRKCDYFFNYSRVDVETRTKHANKWLV